MWGHLLLKSLAGKHPYMYTLQHIYTNGITLWTKLVENAAIFCLFVCLCFGFFFPGWATSHVLPGNSPWRDYDMAAWGWLKLVLETWFEYGTESKLLSDDWSIMSLSSSSSLQFSRSSSLLPGKPFMLELFPLPWIPFAWREGREGSYEEEVPFSPEKLQIKKKINNYV